MLAPAEVATAPMTPHPFAVRKKRHETSDTVTLWLEPLDGSAHAFLPGQFDMLYAFGAGEVPVSFSGDARDTSASVHTIRAVGAVTRALCAMRAGDVVGVRGPFGTAWDADEAIGRDVVIVAGGIGLAPLRSLVYDVLARPSQFRSVSLLVGARSPDVLLYRSDLRAWRSHMHVGVTVDHADATWRGSVGLVTELLPHAPFDPARTTAFVCGPEVMMRVSANALVELGVDPRQVRVSLERNMKCAIAQCGHCQLGSVLVCRDGPVFPYDRVRPLMSVREL